MYLELAVGQYFQSGNITIWGKLNPFMKGIGYAVVLINILMLSYYNTLQAYALYYLSFSFQSPVPWSTCDKEWSTIYCKDKQQQNLNRSLNNSKTGEMKNENSLKSNDDNGNSTNVYLSASEFFNRKLLGSHRSTGFDDLKGIKLDILLCVFIIFLITTGCLIGGIRTSGKAVYVTAILPYICLSVLIFQSLLLDGSYDGLVYYLTPKFDKLFHLDVWLAAAVQIFFSLGPGFGVLVTYSSYSKKSTNIQTMTLLCSVVNCLTSLLYGVVVFAGIGYMAKRLKVDINYFLQDGIGLVYIVYPEIIATFKHAYIFAVVFFLMLLSLGLDSAFGKYLS
jgi:SNF family Na+-dependent transporter